jgi:hypothetical protein
MSSARNWRVIWTPRSPEPAASSSAAESLVSARRAAPKNCSPPRGAGDGHARAATLYAEAAESYETIGLVLYASRLAEKRAHIGRREPRSGG